MKHHQLTLMFTDIVGYSRLMSQNEAQTIELLGEYRRILLEQIERHKGTVIEYIGDAVFARFETPQSAVSAGVQIQKALYQFNQDASSHLPRLQSRIGIHMGEVALKDNAVFGDDVNIAARLEPIAVADGLCISEKVYKAVREELEEPVLPLGVQPLKNIEEKIRCYLVRPAGITFGTHVHYFLSKLQHKIKAYRYPIMASVFLLIAAGFYFIPRWLVPGYNANYVEIADFKNLMSEDGGADYFSAGITEALRAQLADMRDVYILDAAKGVRGPIRLEGSVQKVASSLRIAYRLFRRKDNVQIAGGKLDGAYDDIFILQDRVVAEIAGYLADEFQLKNFRPAALKITSDVTAYDYYLQGLQFLRMPQSHDNFDSAIKLFSTALVHDSEFALANAGLCSAYRGKFVLTLTASLASTAEKYCQRALDQDDSLYQVYESLGTIYRDTGRSTEAIELLTRAMDMDNSKSKALIQLGKVYRKQNKLTLAEDHYKRAIVAYPDYWEAYQEYATFLVRQGRQLEAIANYEKALKYTPENTVSLSNLGGTYIHLGDFKKAASFLEKSVDISPSSWGYSNTGTIYYFAGDFKKARRMFEEAVRLAPDDYRMYANLADTLRHLPGEEGRAQEYYQKTIDVALPALQVNEEDVSTHQYLAFAHLFIGDEERAQTYLENAIRLNPTDVDVLYTKVKFRAISKDYDKALEDLEALLNSGYSLSLIEADPDLNSLLNLPAFQQVLVKADVD